MGANPSTFTAAYDGDGNLVSESYPADVVATSHYDNLGALTSLSYAAGGTTIAMFSQAANAFGEIRNQSSPESTQTLSYDADARLAQVVDTGDSTCLTRAYSFDADTNRTGLSTYPADSAAACSTSTTPTTASWSHDGADRTTNTGYSYDPMGRTLTLPGADSSVGGSGTVTLGYYANDMVHSENDGTTTDTFALDAAGRVLSSTSSGSGLTTTNVYGDGSDSPAWQAASDGTWSRNVTDIAGNLAAIQTGTSAGTATLQIVNPHGDVVATLTDPSTGAAAMTNYFESTEFGFQRAADTTKPAHYGWLGGKRRDSGDLAGLVLMGERLYDPYSGRFESVDPVLGGSANNYDYCDQDPINGIDLTGTQNLADMVGVGLPHRRKKHHSWLSRAVSSAGHAVSTAAHAVGTAGRTVGHVARSAWHHTEVTLHHDVASPLARASWWHVAEGVEFGLEALGAVGVGVGIAAFLGWTGIGAAAGYTIAVSGGAGLGYTSWYLFRDGFAKRHGG